MDRHALACARRAGVARVERAVAGVEYAALTAWAMPVQLRAPVVLAAAAVHDQGAIRRISSERDAALATWLAAHVL
eukprot:6913784-Prymnesium_polylepis.2